MAIGKDLGENVVRVGAEVLEISRMPHSRVSALAVLRYRAADHERALRFVVRVAITEKAGAPWDRIQRRVVSQAWKRFDAYLDGAPEDRDVINIFSDLAARDRAQPGGGLTDQQEKELRDELAQIEADFARRPGATTEPVPHAQGDRAVAY
jgi:hypothetical protein